MGIPGNTKPSDFSDQHARELADTLGYNLPHELGEDEQARILLWYGKEELDRRLQLYRDDIIVFKEVMAGVENGINNDPDIRFIDQNIRTRNAERNVN